MIELGLDIGLDADPGRLARLDALERRYYSHGCQWPSGDRLCGAAVVLRRDGGRSSWCAEHYRLAHPSPAALKAEKLAAD